MLRAGEGMLDAGPDSPVLGLPRRAAGPANALAVRDDEDCVDVSAVSEDGYAPH